MDFACSKMFKDVQKQKSPHLSKRKLLVSVEFRDFPAMFDSQMYQQPASLSLAGYSLAVVHGAGSFGHQHAKEQLG